MLSKIKELADEAVKLQNKNRMDEVLREISAMCMEVANNKLPLKDIEARTPNKIITMQAEEGKEITSGAMAVKTEKGVKPAKGVKADE